MNSDLDELGTSKKVIRISDMGIISLHSSKTHQVQSSYKYTSPIQFNFHFNAEHIVPFPAITSLQIRKESNLGPVLAQHSRLPNPWIYQQNDQVILPITRISRIQLPNGLQWVPPLIEPPTDEVSKEDPTSVHDNAPKEAARMIVIRRKKMKKHKLKKLRKRMKFEWAKLRQRRELKKEKLFQAKLIQQCKEAESFSAEQYVQERIDKLNEILLSRSVKRQKTSVWVKEMKLKMNT